MKTKNILYFVFLMALCSHAIADKPLEEVCKWDKKLKPGSYHSLIPGNRQQIIEYVPPKSSIVLEFTHENFVIENVFWTCTNNTENSGISNSLDVPKELNGLIVTDFKQFTGITPLSPLNNKPITTPSIVKATLQAAAFNDNGEMLPLDDWLNSQKDIFPSPLLDIADFTRTDESGPLYFCVPLNKLVLKELTIPLTSMNATYQVEDGKITQLNSGNGPSPKQLEDFYLSSEECHLNSDSFGTLVASESNGDKWGNDNPFNGEVQLFTKHGIILLVKLNSVSASVEEEGIKLAWQTNRETKNAGFQVWRGIENGTGSYEATLLREFGNSEPVDPELNEDCLIKIQGQLKEANSNPNLKLISAIGNSTESTCYSFTDTSNLNDGTYYYLIEDISNDGKSTFHCNHIDAVTIGQSPDIDLKSAKKYCKKITGSNN